VSKVGALCAPTLLIFVDALCVRTKTKLTTHWSRSKTLPHERQGFAVKDFVNSDLVSDVAMVLH